MMQPSVPVLLAFLALVLIVSVPQSVGDARHSVYLEGADGLGHLFERQGTDLTRKDDPIRIIHGDLKGLDPTQEALLIVGPRVAYTEEEIDRVEVFLRQGGRVLLADDRGSGRGLLDGLDVGLSIPEGQLFSTSYQGDPSLPIAESTGFLGELPETVVLHEPRPIMGDTGQAVLLSHPFSWFDRNNNGRPDLDEPRAAFPLAKTVQLGVGELLVVGDPDLFTERLADINGEEVQDVLLAWLTEDGQRTIVVDEGHRAAGDPLGVAPVLAGDAPWQAYLLVALGLTATILIAFRVRLRRVTPQRRPPQHHAKRKDAMERAVLRELPVR